jgi:hypothetical protein
VWAALGDALILPARIWRETARDLVAALAGGATTTLSGPVGVVASARTDARTSTVLFLGVINAYYLWIPILAALILFPRTRRPRS